MPAWWVEISWLPRNGEEPNGVGYCLMVKSQIRPATLLMMANSAMKPATLVRIGAFASGLNKSRSIRSAPGNAKCRLERDAAKYGTPYCINCQDRKVENIAISPCAKFRWSIA